MDDSEPELTDDADLSFMFFRPARSGLLLLSPEGTSICDGWDGGGGGGGAGGTSLFSREGSGGGCGGCCGCCCKGRFADWFMDDEGGGGGGGTDAIVAVLDSDCGAMGGGGGVASSWDVSEEDWSIGCLGNDV